MKSNDETENKKGAGKKVIPVFYSTVPNILIQTKMLERIEMTSPQTLDRGNLKN